MTKLFSLSDGVFRTFRLKTFDLIYHTFNPNLSAHSLCFIVACIRMAEDAHGRVVMQYAFKASCGAFGTIGYHYHTRMLRVTHAYPAAMVERYPGCSARCISHQVQHSGQSDTASEPSFIDSVSRFGDATDPQSK
jgi:hypothetical protein